MFYKDVMQKVKEKRNGSWRSIQWVKPMQLLKEYQGHTAVKVSRAVVRFGVEYSHLNGIEAMPDGRPRPLPWGQWKEYPYTIVHNDCYYLRCTFGSNNKVRSQYFLDGKRADKAVLESMCRKASDTIPKVMTISFVNITDIR